VRRLNLGRKMAEEEERRVDREEEVSEIVDKLLAITACKTVRAARSFVRVCRDRRARASEGQAAEVLRRPQGN